MFLFLFSFPFYFYKKFEFEFDNFKSKNLQFIVEKILAPEKRHHHLKMRQFCSLLPPSDNNFQFITFQILEISIQFLFVGVGCTGNSGSSLINYNYYAIIRRGLFRRHRSQP
jgi:hypothetical protein